jgi:hypothetical protein
VLAALMNFFSPAESDIAVRSRVNRVHNILGAERVDGLVINVSRGVAHVAWPNGETTVESIKYLCTIVA